MATTLEERVRELEVKVARLIDEKGESHKEAPWWERRFGAFRDDPLYDEAARLGAEYRKSQPTAADEISDDVCS